MDGNSEHAREATPPRRAPRRRRGEGLGISGGRSGTTIHGGAAVVFALPFIGIGAVLAAIASGSLRVAGRQEPRVAWAAAALFGGAGIWLLLHGVGGLLRAARVQRSRAAHPQQPWRADHEWPPRAIPDETRREAARFATAGLWLGTFLAVFAVLGAGIGLRPFRLVVLGGLSLLAIVPVAAIAKALAVAARARRQGRVELRGTFPFFLGGPLQAVVAWPRPVGGALEIELRCREDRYVTANRRQAVVVVERHAETRTLAAGAFDPRFTEIRLDLPPDPALTTALAERPPRYWELTVRSEDGTVEAKFLVPVYARVG